MAETINHLSPDEITSRSQYWNQKFESGSNFSNYQFCNLIGDIINIRGAEGLNLGGRVSKVETQDYSYILESLPLDEGEYLLFGLKRAIITGICKKVYSIETFKFTHKVNDPYDFDNHPTRAVRYDSGFGFKVSIPEEEVKLNDIERKNTAKTIWQAHLRDRTPMETVSTVAEVK